MSHDYYDPCQICGTQVFPYTVDPSKATGVIVFFPNLDHIGQENRASAYVFCHDCLAKFEEATGKRMAITIDDYYDRTKCISLLDDPTIESRSGNNDELYLAVAHCVSREYHKLFAPLSMDDYRRYLQIKCTGDWQSWSMYDFVSDKARDWRNVDFRELVEILWKLYTFKIPRKMARVIVRQRTNHRWWPTYDAVKTEHNVNDQFAVMVSTDQELSNRSAIAMSNDLERDYPILLEDFEIDIETVRKFFKVGGYLVDGTIYAGQAQVVNKVLTTDGIDVSFSGNIGYLRVRSNGAIRYKT